MATQGVFDPNENPETRPSLGHQEAKPHQALVESANEMQATYNTEIDNLRTALVDAYAKNPTREGWHTAIRTAGSSFLEGCTTKASQIFETLGRALSPKRTKAKAQGGGSLRKEASALRAAPTTHCVKMLRRVQLDPLRCKSY